MRGTGVDEVTPRTFSVRSLCDLCIEIDALPRSFTGEIVLSRAGSAPLGVVFVEAQRICWAAAKGLSRRLRHLLALDPVSVEEHYQTCKTEGIPLGELLVRRGVVDQARLRSALLQHTTESLSSILVAEARGSITPREGGYSPRFTFSTAEVLAAPFANQAARAELDAHFEGLGWGAAFVRGDSAIPRLVALSGDHPADATSLAKIGRWAASVVDLGLALQPERQENLLVTTQRGHRTLVAIETKVAILAGEIGGHGAARILNRRAALRRATEKHHGDL